MARSAWKRWLRGGAIVGAGVLVATAAGCLRVSNGTWYFRSAATPEGWPALTPVGVVEVKDYPAYRAASVEQAAIDEQGMDPMFMTLFRHIDDNRIAMTAPVAMEYEPAGAAPRMASMAFLYRDGGIGAPGRDGAVSVQDLPPRTFASVGVRGDYTSTRYAKGLRLVEAWLADSAEWTADGPPRYLGYNSPFVPAFWRYGEVQIPVRRVQSSPPGGVAVEGRS